MATGVTAAVAPPAINAVQTAPRGFFNNLDLVGWRMSFEVLAIVRKFCQLIGLDGVQGIGESHVAEAVVMAVTFTVRGDMDELGPVALIVKGPAEPIGQVLAAGEKSFKGDSASDRSVIEKQSDLSTRRQPLFVCLGRIDARAADVLPAPSSEGTDAAGLMRGKNGETNSQL